MIHSTSLTMSELAELANFFIWKNENVFNVKDLIVVTVRDVETNLPTGQQVFFTVTDVKTDKEAKGIKRGFAMLKIKRTKNPIPKVTDTDNETEETEDVS